MEPNLTFCIEVTTESWKTPWSLLLAKRDFSFEDGLSRSHNMGKQMNAFAILLNIFECIFVESGGATWNHHQVLQVFFSRKSFQCDNSIILPSVRMLFASTALAASAF